jgi:hypothetical protein
MPFSPKVSAEPDCETHGAINFDDKCLLVVDSSNGIVVAHTGEGKMLALCPTDLNGFLV